MLHLLGGAIPHQLRSGQDLVGPGLFFFFFFLGDEFSSPGNKREKAANSNKGIFENFKKKFTIPREKKELKVTTFRQCASLDGQDRHVFLLHVVSKGYPPPVALWTGLGSSRTRVFLTRVNQPP